MKLKDLIESNNTGLDAIKRAPIVEYDTGIRCLRIGDISNNRPFNDWGYTEVEDNNYKKFQLRKDDIIVARTGATIGVNKYIDKDYKSVYNNGLIRIRVKEENNPKYVYYLLQSNNYRNFIKTISMGTSTQPNMQMNDLLNLEVPEFDRDKQDKIVQLLGNIDKKIELNNEINNNLYELAIKYLNEMKSDEEVTLSKFGKIQGGYAFKSKDLLDTKTNNRIIKIKNLRNEISADVINSQFVENEVIDKLDNKFKIKKGNVVIAMTGAELGKTGFIYGFDHYYLNQRVGLVRGITKEKELYLNILLLSQEFQNLLNSKGYGSAQPNVSTTDIENITIQNIEDDDLMKFYEKVNPIYKKIILNCEENLNLEQLRDTLLPKLMNGEIDLDNIEI